MKRISFVNIAAYKNLGERGRLFGLDMEGQVWVKVLGIIGPKAGNESEIELVENSDGKWIKIDSPELEDAFPDPDDK